MTARKGVKDKIAGKTKRVAGEVVGDQKLHDEGQAQEQRGNKENEKPSEIKPLGNLDELT